MKETGIVISTYKPDLTAIKPSEQRKVEILESTVLYGSLEDLKAVLEKYVSFEMTSRALGLAARYRGVEFVRMLAEHGATFKYKRNYDFQTKYNTDQKTSTGSYKTEYYLMPVPKSLDGRKMRLHPDYHYKYCPYEYTPLYGVIHLPITDELERKALDLEEKIKVLKYFLENEKLCASADEMLYWALTHGEFEVADALMDMGVNLCEEQPSYFSSRDEANTYIDMLTLSDKSVYWSDYSSWMIRLDAEYLLPTLERLDKLAKTAGEKIILTQKLFDELKWNDKSLEFAIKNLNVSKINQKKALESAASQNYISALAAMADIGWLSQTAKREKLIEYAQSNNYIDALTWLLDFKNRTVNITEEAAKEEAQIHKKLTEDSNSASALKRNWSYKKLDDGTLQITSYKGQDTEIILPSKIGKNEVSSIGEYAFSPRVNRKPANEAARKSITSVVLPEGITEICEAAFLFCESLEEITLPSTLKINSIKGNTFRGCKGLYSNGLLIIGDVLIDCVSQSDIIEVPYGVTEISEDAFCGYGYYNNIEKIIFPDTVRKIGSHAFSYFLQCDFYIPDSVTEFGYSDIRGSGNTKCRLHTTEGSYISEYFKENYPDLEILYDYGM